MQKTQLQQKKSSVSAKRLLGVTAALLVFFLLLTSVIGLFEKRRVIKTRIHELSVEQDSLEQKKSSLSSVNNDLESPEGKEYALRTKYNLVKPGEGMVIVTDPSKDIEPVIDTRPRVLRWWDNILHGLGIRKD